ncbi:MAG TPA: DUF4365 domain-containing protein [Solirubrobacterales bacterium]|jgi:hypothetical protein|nr:DUF4365 domain-containing protein [Solirubrobacterales bacterium]
MSPKIGETEFTARYGINKVERMVLAARCVWRPTSLQDIGIDGQIEHVAPDGEATGRLIAAQVKSGASYFRRKRGDRVLHEVSEKHAGYWATFPLPVILILHEEESDLTIWADARSALRRSENPVEVETSNTFDADGVLRALSLEGPLPAAKAVPEEIAREMCQARYEDQGLSMSFLDLFSHGLTTLARNLYFSMDLFLEVGQANAALEGRAGGWGFGPSAFEFIDRYVAFLVARNLARVDFDAWRAVASELQMTDQFIVPLTAPGRELVEEIARLNQMLPLGEQGPVIEERSVNFLPLRMSERAVALGAIADRLRPDS